jgi:hypothetical protein
MCVRSRGVIGFWPSARRAASQMDGGERWKSFLGARKMKQIGCPARAGRHITTYGWRTDDPSAGARLAIQKPVIGSRGKSDGRLSRQ